MAQCKECGDVFGVVAIRNGVCKYCITGEVRPTVLIKASKTYLTDDERAKIIEEETLRAEIGNSGTGRGFLDYLIIISGSIFMALALGALIVGGYGFITGIK